MNGSEKCFGSRDAESPRCRECCYSVSCEYYQKTASSVESRLRMTSLDNLAPWSRALIDHQAVIPGEEEEDESLSPKEETLTLQELIYFFGYLMRMDHYTLSVLRELLDSSREDPCTIGKLSRRFGVTRQAVYRKILRIAKKHPELRYVLRGTFTRMLPRHTV